MIEKELENKAKKLGVDLEELQQNVFRTISAEEILYLLDRCPFLQMVCSNAEIEPHAVEIMPAATNWPIHNYGDAMSSSPGPLLYNSGFYRTRREEDDDEGGSGIVTLGSGTIVKQAWDTACEMVALAKHLNWAGVILVDGHPLMRRAAWLKAMQIGLRVEGFEPNTQDLKVQNRLNLSETDIEALKQQIRSLQRT